MSTVPAVFLVQFLLTTAACVGLWRLCRVQPKIVIAGFLVRALLGQALFWISYLRLPIGRSLQLGNGFWFFAVDGPFYLDYAAKLVAGGPAASENYPSLFFVRVLALCLAAFGSVASIAILLNCAAYLLTCAIIVRVSPTRNRVVLAVLACSPASILFSLQPLKDTLFMLLIVAMVAAFLQWEERWRSGGTPAQLLAAGIIGCAVLYALAGVRWYFALIACGAAAAVFPLMIALQADRKGLAFVANALLPLLLSQLVRLGATSDLPPTYARLLDPKTALQWRPRATQDHFAEVRKGFESTPGATTIAAGAAIAQREVAPADTGITANDAIVKPDAAPASATIAAGDTAAQPDVAPAASTITADDAVAPADITRAQPTPGEPASRVPPSFASRIITGFAAMFVPRILAESLDLIHVGGGRGLWLFAEMDTLLLDLALVYAIVHCVLEVRRRRATITATFVLCVLLFLGAAGAMLYTVNNFGTLFRLRLMVFCVVAILPITLRDRVREH